jgi:hypothetical protein
MGSKGVSAIFLVSLMAILFLTGAAASAMAVGGPPYEGVIKNHTRYDISIPSDNSGATLVIPAKGWIEYVSWSPNFQMMGYVNGNPLHCQKIQVNPKNYTFMCRSYDFVAEIVAEEKPPKKPRPVRKKRQKKEVKAKVGL